MIKVSVLAILVVSVSVVGCSNHTQQDILRIGAPPYVGVTSLFPSTHAVSQAPSQEVSGLAHEIAEFTKPDRLSAIAIALDQDKTEFCQSSQFVNCDKEFIRAIRLRRVTLSKSGQLGFIVEFSGADFCGSAGCAINVLKTTGDKIERTLENDEVGSLDSFEFATTITNGFYDLTKHGKDGTNYHYSWTGSNYEYVESAYSAGQARTIEGTAESAQNECKDCVTEKPAAIP